MPVMMIMEWKGVTADQYEQVRRSVKWETDVPDGAMFHVASIGDGALHVTDIWQSPDDFNRFVQDRPHSRCAAGRHPEPARREGLPGPGDLQPVS